MTATARVAFNHRRPAPQIGVDLMLRVTLTGAGSRHLPGQTHHSHSNSHFGNYQAE